MDTADVGMWDSWLPFPFTVFLVVSPYTGTRVDIHLDEVQVKDIDEDISSLLRMFTGLTLMAFSGINHGSWAFIWIFIMSHETRLKYDIYSNRDALSIQLWRDWYFEYFTLSAQACSSGPFWGIAPFTVRYAWCLMFRMFIFQASCVRCKNCAAPS